MQDNKTKLIGLIVIALLAVAGTSTVIMLNNQPAVNDTATTQTQDTTATTQSESSSEQAAADSYKDGTYDADGSYRTPGGTESVNVKVTLVNNTITAVEVMGSGNGESAQYQGMFKEGISDAVVGKNIDEIQVSRVSGSSLTSTGFNNAIETIKKDATTAA